MAAAGDRVGSTLLFQEYSPPADHLTDSLTCQSIPLNALSTTYFTSVCSSIQVCRIRFRGNNGPNQPRRHQCTSAPSNPDDGTTIALFTQYSPPDHLTDILTSTLLCQSIPAALPSSCQSIINHLFKCILQVCRPPLFSPFAFRPTHLKHLKRLPSHTHPGHSSQTGKSTVILITFHCHISYYNARIDTPFPSQKTCSLHTQPKHSHPPVAHSLTDYRTNC